MPSGSLTPLGRRLRSVLASFCNSQQPTLDPSHALPLRTILGNQNHAYHATNSSRSAAVAATAEEPAFTFDTTYEDLPKTPRQLSRRRLNRRTRVDRITEVLRDGRRVDVTPALQKNRVDLSHVNVRSYAGRAERAINAKRHINDVIPALVQNEEVTLETILANAIHHCANHPEIGRTSEHAGHHLQPAEATILHQKGYDIDDVEAWADLLISADSYKAATELAMRVTSHGPHAVPFSVLLYILRRPYISARALRILIAQAWTILDYRKSTMVAHHISDDSVFLVFLRLLRHAREIWPRALAVLPELLIQHLPSARSIGQASTTNLETLTYMLNKAMRLLAIPIAIEPFKNNVYQEAGIVRILRFMAEHDPPLQTNREGYRAVIVIQLAQRKTEKERDWAELKALSWPPWKQERNAMDADITADYHGRSKAAQTLIRMREAGYGHLAWEDLAMIYSGWDTDGTPTIQTLALLGTGGAAVHSKAALWAARIATTRTAQEAWACFLAYDATKLPPSQDVYLATVQKLHQEHHRQRKLSPEFDISEDRMFSGDRREVEPLPPSTHLYTFTRTPPPTVDGFYRQMRDRGIILNARCLAFMVSNATSLKLGVEYLLDGAKRYPQIHSLIPSTSPPDLNEVSMPLFAAFIELLSRFSAVPLDSALRGRLSNAPGNSMTSDILKKERLNSNHTIVRALELLAQRRPLFRPAWNSVLKSLARDTSHVNIRADFIRYTQKEIDLPNEDEVKAHGAIVAYRLVRRVLSLMREVHLDVDVMGFQSLCQAVENLAAGCWQILRADVRMRGKNATAHILRRVKEARRLIRSSSHVKRLRASFVEIVGEDGTDLQYHIRPEEQNGLLEVPGPAVLHSYVRALGWMADYSGLSETARWMVQHQAELHQRCERDRNGEAMMRRTIIALRVFLERSWLSESGKVFAEADTAEELPDNVRKDLKRLETSAPSAIIDEVRSLVEGVDEWGDWPETEELEQYCAHERFQRFNAERCKVEGNEIP